MIKKDIILVRELDIAKIKKKSMTFLKTKIV